MINFATAMGTVGTVILAIIILIVFGLVFHGICDFAENQWYKDKGKSCFNAGCGIITVLLVIGLCFAMLVGMVKSCASDFDRSPGRDYYDDRAR